MISTQTLQQWVVVTQIPQVGPRGGYRKPITERFLVAAESREDARAAFDIEMPDLKDYVIGVVDCRCRVMRQ